MRRVARQNCLLELALRDFTNKSLLSNILLSMKLAKPMESKSAILICETLSVLYYGRVFTYPYTLWLIVVVGMCIVARLRATKTHSV